MASINIALLRSEETLFYFWTSLYFALRLCRRKNGFRTSDSTAAGEMEFKDLRRRQ
jgi:hypothetical protein